MWWGTTVCESSLSLQNPNTQSDFQSPDVYQFFWKGAERFLFQISEWCNPTFVQGDWALVHGPQRICAWGKKIAPVAPWELWEKIFWVIQVQEILGMAVLPCWTSDPLGITAPLGLARPFVFSPPGFERTDGHSSPFQIQICWVFKFLNLFKNWTHSWQFLNIFPFYWMPTESDQECPQSVYLTPRVILRWFVL